MKPLQRTLHIMLALVVFACTQGTVREAGTEIRVDLKKKKGPMSPVWAWFGYDEPNYTYMKDGKKLLSEIAELSPVPVYVRAHNLLTTGDGRPALKWGSTNAYTEDTNGNPIYNWTITDSIFDTYVERGMRPLVEIGFMPEALSTKPKPYQHKWKPGAPYSDIYTGWAYPPNNYKKWAELVYQWVKHCVEKYGQEEVEKWYWELWNEPNIGYWQGTQAEYNKLYDYTADAVKRALPTSTFGGPHTTGPSWPEAEKFLRAFLDHVVSGKNYVTGATGAPIDFIAFHAKGGPKLQGDSIVLMNLGTQLRDISKGFEIVASYPTLKSKPIIIGESDPEGCAACSVKDYPANAYRNGTLYSSYTAAAFARKYELADYWGVNFIGAVTWAFEFEDQPWFNGYRDLATNGVDKPVLNIFRMYGMMPGDRVEVTGDISYNVMTARDSSIREQERDINALASISANRASVMLWNYHDLNIVSPPASVNLVISGIEAPDVDVKHYLYLAPSKIRNCAIGPELVLDISFDSIPGKVAIARGGRELWSKQVRTGEDAMSHTLANLEYHHFKYDQHRIPGQLHIHFFGADAFSFGENIRLQDSDEMHISFQNMGRPLINPVRIDDSEERHFSVRSFVFP